MPKFSLIIPVYNVDKYIYHCLESISKQTFSDFEAIVIDDGSTDDSGKICDEFALKDNRIKEKKKKNGGVSSASNKGLDNAIGEFIYFVDGDDWIEENTLEEINKVFLTNPNADVFSFNYIFNFENESRKSIALTEGIFEGNQKDHLILATIIPKFIERKYSYQLPGIRSKCVKAFKRRIIEDKKIRFNEKIPIGEDALFCSKLLSEAKTVVQRNFYLYHYRVYTQSCNRKYRDQWDYVFERVKCISNDSKSTQNIDYNNVMSTFIFAVIKRILQTYLLHQNNQMSFKEKVVFLKKFTSNENFPKTTISLEMIKFIPEYIPFLFAIKYKLFRTLLFLGKIFFK